MSALRDKLLARPILATREFYAQEWGETILLEELDGNDRQVLMHSAAAARREDATELELAVASQDSMGRLLVRKILDPATMERVFKDEDADMLMGHSGGLLNRLWLELLSLSKIGEGGKGN